MKIPRINIFVKLVEDILEEARKRNRATDELIDWLFMCAGQLLRWYDDITHDKEDYSPIDPRVLQIPKDYFL